MLERCGGSIIIPCPHAVRVTVIIISIATTGTADVVFCIAPLFTIIIDALRVKIAFNQDCSESSKSVQVTFFLFSFFFQTSDQASKPGLFTQWTKLCSLSLVLSVSKVRKEVIVDGDDSVNRLFHVRGDDCDCRLSIGCLYTFVSRNRSRDYYAN